MKFENERTRAARDVKATANKTKSSALRWIEDRIAVHDHTPVLDWVEVERLLGRTAPIVNTENRYRGAYCHDCIDRELGLSRRQHANRLTNALASTSNFCRGRGTCSVCGAEKKVFEEV